MTLIERLEYLANVYPKLDTLESKTENVKERVHLLRRTEQFEQRKQDTFAFPKVAVSPSNDDIRFAHEELQMKMRSNEMNDLKAKLKGKR